MMKSGTMSVTETKEEFNPIQESSPTEGQDESSSFVNMQIELHNKGTVLTKAWSDLFSFITKYQAELVMRENSVEIAEKEIKERKKQLEELAGSGNDETLQDVIYTKERKLRKSQSELDVKDRMLQKVQSDLSSHMELLEKSQCDLLKKQSDLVRYRGNVEQLKSELNVKEEQIKIKDTLLKKLQNQLMKENAELKEQLELERQALLFERQSHGSTKGTMSSPGPNTRKRARTNADSATVIDIPASPPTLDLSEDQNFGLSSIISMTESQTESSEPGRRVSSRLKKSVASASQLSTDHSSRLCQRPTAIASSEVSYTTPQKDAQYMASPPISDSTAATSDTYFPLSVSDDTKLLDISSIKVDNGIQDEAPPATVHVSPCSGASDNEGDGTVSEVVQSPEGSTDTKSTTRELEDELLSAALSSIGAIPVDATITINGVEVSAGKVVKVGTGASCGMTETGTISVADVAFSAGTILATPASSASTSTSTIKRKEWKNRKPDQKKFNCKYCEKSFTTSSGVIIHTRTHTGDKPFKCSTCLKAFAREDTLRYHIMIHTGEKPMKCPICGKGFRDKKGLRYHLLSHKELIPAIDIILKEQCHEVGTANYIYKCKICQKECRGGVGKYKEHLTWHKELAPALHSILREQKTHRDIKAALPKEPKERVQCSMCDRTFERKSLLKVHFRSHTGEKPCLCSICGKSYRTYGNLSKHMQAHAGIERRKTKQCSYCNKLFRDVTGWREHQRIHTGEMPYTCHLCGKTFRYKSNLNAHLHTHRE